MASARHPLSRRAAPRHAARGLAPHRARLTRTTVVVALASSAALVGTPAGADPNESSWTAITARVDQLHTQAEQATEKYNAAAERVEVLRGRVERAQDRIVRHQVEVNALRDELGATAGRQYRTGGVSPALVLLLTSDPESYLRKAATLDRIGDRQQTQLHDLVAALRQVDQQRREGSATLRELERERSALRRHQETVERRLDQARRLLDRLTPDQRAHRNGAGPDGTGRPVNLRDLGPLSARARTAVSAAIGAIGAPYGWGMAGPNSFDCSGLTQWAYAQAGVALPRTSQAQSTAGTRVPLRQARPGDLVVYRPDAGHVALYVGNGQVVHAPRPGARVRYDPVGMMPVHSVTRP